MQKIKSLAVSTSLEKMSFIVIYRVVDGGGGSEVLRNCAEMYDYIKDSITAAAKTILYSRNI